MGDLIGLEEPRDDVLPGVHRHDQPGYFSLAELPQRASIEHHAFGTGWWELDQILKFYLGQFVVVTGIAGHGKSTFLLNVIHRLAKLRGTSSFLYVPENEGFLRDKFEKLWGQDPAFEYFCEGQCFVQSSTPHTHREPPHTLRWVLEKAQTAVENDGVELVLIDPWNELERSKPRDMLMTDHIGESLMMLKQFCRALNVIVIIVAHPTKAVNEHGGRIATLGDIEGSMNWFNKCDNGLIVVRDADKDTSRVISAKVREIGAGKLGVCHFYVDPQTGIYTPQLGGVIAK